MFNKETISWAPRWNCGKGNLFFLFGARWFFTGITSLGLVWVPVQIGRVLKSETHLWGSPRRSLRLTRDLDWFIWSQSAGTVKTKVHSHIFKRNTFVPKGQLSPDWNAELSSKEWDSCQSTAVLTLRHLFQWNLCMVDCTLWEIVDSVQMSWWVKKHVPFPPPNQCSARMAAPFLASATSQRSLCLLCHDVPPLLQSKAASSWNLTFAKSLSDTVAKIRTIGFT